MIVWDDGERARERAELLGLRVIDLTKFSDWPSVAGLIVSPGIPHFYPAPHSVILAAMRAQVPVDNDVGLFFRSFASLDWAAFDIPPPQASGMGHGVPHNVVRNWRHREVLPRIAAADLAHYQVRCRAIPSLRVLALRGHKRAEFTEGCAR